MARRSGAQTISDSPGVLKVLTAEDRGYYTYEDVMRLYGVKKAKAYQIISYLREEGIKEGRLAPCVPAGKIPKEIFRSRMGLG